MRTNYQFNLILPFVSKQELEYPNTFLLKKNKHKNKIFIFIIGRIRNKSKIFILILHMLKTSKQYIQSHSSFMFTKHAQKSDWKWDITKTGQVWESQKDKLNVI